MSDSTVIDILKGQLVIVEHGEYGTDNVEVIVTTTEGISRFTMLNYHACELARVLTRIFGCSAGDDKE